MMFPADRHPLDDSHWLSQVPAAFRKDVLDLCSFRRLNDQELTLGAEDAPGSVIGVVSGALALERDVPGQGFVPVWLLQEGTWRAVDGTFQGDTRGITLRAAGPAEIVELSAMQVQRIAEAHEDGWRWFAQISAGQAQLATEVSLSFMQLDGAVRMANLLLRLCRSGRADGALMPVALAEADLARICGLTLLALGRGLGVLAALGLVRHVNGVIEILSEPKLSAWLGPRAVPSAYAGGAADASNRRIA